MKVCENFSSRWKPSTASRVFTYLLWNSPKPSPRFTPGYEDTESMFHFLIISRSESVWDGSWTKRKLQDYDKIVKSKFGIEYIFEVDKDNI